MQERRVWVTAKSAQNGESRATGFPQFDAEMAAPTELRTPRGTRGGEPRPECGWKCDDRGAGVSGQKAIANQSRDGARGAHEAPPQTPPGDKPPETPGPLSLNSSWYGRARFRQGFAAPAQGAALDGLSPFPHEELIAGKGDHWNAALVRPPVGRPGRLSRLLGDRRAARALRRCLRLRQGARAP
jgi:hypothetical protein